MSPCLSSRFVWVNANNCKGSAANGERVEVSAASDMEQQGGGTLQYSRRITRAQTKESARTFVDTTAASRRSEAPQTWKDTVVKDPHYKKDRTECSNHCNIRFVGKLGENTTKVFLTGLGSIALRNAHIPRSSRASAPSDRQSMKHP